MAHELLTILPYLNAATVHASLCSPIKSNQPTIQSDLRFVSVIVYKFAMPDDKAPTVELDRVERRRRGRGWGATCGEAEASSNNRSVNGSTEALETAWVRCMLHVE